jgi:hypothetical protein
MEVEKRTVSMRALASPQVPPPRAISLLLLLLPRFALHHLHWIVRQYPPLARSAAEAEAALVVAVASLHLVAAAVAVAALAAAVWISSS